MAVRRWFVSLAMLAACSKSYDAEVVGTPDSSAPEDSGAPQDSSTVTDAGLQTDARVQTFCERARADGGAVLFCADFDDGSEAGTTFDSITNEGAIVTIGLVTTPVASPPRAAAVDAPADAGAFNGSLNADFQLPAPTATLAFKWRVESTADLQTVTFARFDVLSPGLQLGQGISVVDGGLSACGMAPTVVVPNVWHQVELLILPGSVRCVIDGVRGSVNSTNGNATALKIALGLTRYMSFPFPEAGTPKYPAARVFFDDVILTNP